MLVVEVIVPGSGGSNFLIYFLGFLEGFLGDGLGVIADVAVSDGEREDEGVFRVFAGPFGVEPEVHVGFDEQDDWFKLAEDGLEDDEALMDGEIHELLIVFRVCHKDPSCV